MNRQVDAMVLAITEDSVLKKGLPLARYDALVLAGKQWPQGEQASATRMRNLEQLWLQHLLPACDGVVMVQQAAGIKVDGIEKVTAAQWFEISGSERELVERTVQLVLRNR